MEYEHHIFLSYSRRDTKMMLRIKESLSLLGYDLWTDEKLTAGTPSWKNSIEKAISNAGCLVVLLSPASKNSQWVERELDYATAQGKRIFPILVDGDEITAIPFELISSQYVDVRTDYDRALETLAQGVGLYLEVLLDSSSGDTTKSKRYEDNFLQTPQLSFKERMRHGRKLIEWHFLNPKALAKFRGIIDAAPVVKINALVISYLLAAILFIPLFLAFPGAYEYYPNTIFIPLFMFAVVWRHYVRDVGANQWTILGFLWQIFKRMILLFLIGIGLIVIYGVAVIVLPDEFGFDSFGSIPVFAGMISLLLICCFVSASVIGHVVQTIGRFKVYMMIIAIAVFWHLVAFFVIIPSLYSTWRYGAYHTRPDYVALYFLTGIVNLLINIAIYSGLKWLLRKYRSDTVAKAIASVISGGITTWGGVLSIVGIAIYVLSDIDPSLNGLTQVTPDLSLIAPSLVLLVIISVSSCWLIFGFGGNFALRFRDAHLLGFLTSVLLFACGLFVSGFCVYFFASLQETGYATSSTLSSIGFYRNVFLTMCTLSLLPVILGMYVGGVVGGALKGFNVIIDFFGLIFGTLLIAHLIHMNGWVIGSGLRGLVLLGLLGIILIFVYRNRTGSLKLIYFLTMLSVAFAVLRSNFLHDYYYFRQPTIISPVNGIALIVGTLFLLITIIGGYWIGKLTLRHSRLNLALNGALIILLVLLPIAYLLNI